MQASQRNRSPIPFWMMYIGPPTHSPVLLRCRYRTERVASANFVTIPKIALTHIQKIAPGPPIAIAPATPARFPVPTVAARAVHSALNGDTPPSVSLLPFNVLRKSLSAFGSNRNCTNPVRMVRYRPTPRIPNNAGTPQTSAVICSKKRSIAIPPNKKAVPLSGNCFCVIPK